MQPRGTGPADADYILLAIDRATPRARCLAIGAGLTYSDGGPGGFFTISLGDLVTQATTPAQITADQNDYAGCTGNFCRVSTDATRTLTGMLAEVDGYRRVIANVGTNRLQFDYDSALSAAANRIYTGTGDTIYLEANQSVKFIYDGTSQKWRRIS